MEIINGKIVGEAMNPEGRLAVHLIKLNGELPHLVNPETYKQWKFAIYPMLSFYTEEELNSMMSFCKDDKYWASALRSMDAFVTIVKKSESFLENWRGSLLKKAARQRKRRREEVCNWKWG